jgi:hypothetical protein
MTNSLESISLIATYSAMAVYTLAFILFTVDLAGRAASDGQSPPTRWLRSGMAVLVLGFAIHFGAVITRGISAHRVP